MLNILVSDDHRSNHSHKKDDAGSPLTVLHPIGHIQRRTEQHKRNDGLDNNLKQSIHTYYKLQCTGHTPARQQVFAKKSRFVATKDPGYVNRGLLGDLFT